VLTQGEKTGAPTMLALTELAVVEGVSYSLKAGAHTGVVTAANGETVSTLAGKLVSALNTAAGSTVASAQSITVTNSWASVLGELERQIEAGEAIGAAVDLTLPKLTLTSTDGNKSFSIDAVGADPDDRFTALGTNPLTLAASGIKQVSELSLAPGVSVASGDVYTLVLTDNSGVPGGVRLPGQHAGDAADFHQHAAGLKQSRAD
jgi:hypothetical protein